MVKVMRCLIILFVLSLLTDEGGKVFEASGQQEVKGVEVQEDKGKSLDKDPGGWGWGVLLYI